MISTQGSHPILTQAVQFRLFGKSPASFYLRLNELIWNWLPLRVRDWSLIRAYGEWLHTLVCLRATRRQYFGTFFLRNRPALELIRRLSDKKTPGATFSIAVLGCSIGAEVYSILFAIRTARPDLKVVLHGVDISEEILNFAERGVYNPDTCTFVGASIFERLTAEEKEAMFVLEGNQATIKKPLREGIIWKLGDAADPGLSRTLGLQDLVVGSNFLCHMPPADAERCLLNMARLVVPSGHIFVSGVDLDVRTKVAVDLGWKPVPDLMEDIHNGDVSILVGWPWRWWALEPLDRRKPDWQTRYTAVFQVAEEPASELKKGTASPAMAGS